MGDGHKYAATVARHRTLLDASTVSEASKEALHELLDVGISAVNGCENKIQALTELSLLSHLYHVDKAIMDAKDKELLASELRTSLAFETSARENMASSFTEYIKTRKETCPLKGTAAGDTAGKLAWLFPFRRPLTVVLTVLVLTPNADTIIQTVAHIFGR